MDRSSRPPRRAIRKIKLRVRVRPHHRRHRRYPARRRHGAAGRHRDRGARRPHRRARQFHRRRRRQSGPGGGARRRLLLQALPGGGGASISVQAAPAMRDDRSCENGPSSPSAARDWARHGARWMSPACHRSLYSYQVRTALALAVEQPHLAVTFLPLACTGATIGAGMFAGQRADDCPWVVGIDSCSGTAPAQFAELQGLMAAGAPPAAQAQPRHGAADDRRQRREFRRAWSPTSSSTPRRSGSCSSRAAPSSASHDAQKALEQDLPDEFAQLRTALKPFVGGNLSRVVFVSYANPAMQAADKPCPGGRDGLDVHPAFAADERAAARGGGYSSTRNFCRGSRALATCDGDKTCRDPMTDTHDIRRWTPGGV